MYCTFAIWELELTATTIVFNEVAHTALRIMHSLLCSSQINIKIRTRFLRRYFYSVLFYSAETWTLIKKELRRIERPKCQCTAECAAYPRLKESISYKYEQERR